MYIAFSVTTILKFYQSYLTKFPLNTQDILSLTSFWLLVVVY